jgi:tetratricopeptide (TPR) repeat protein
MRSQNIVIRAIAFSSIALVSVTAAGGIFDNAKNLQVLTENTTAEELRTTMRAFATGTGNRCSACHVGEVEADLSTYDFSLDDKEKKLTARKMIEMTRQINATLADAFPASRGALLTVTCETCHRGQSRPLMIQDILQETVAAEGLDKSIDKYRELRERYYGGFMYDFSERMLMRMAETFGADNQPDVALAFATLNLEYYPQSSRTYLLRGQLLAEQGEIEAARSDLKKALEIEPQSQWIRQQLDKLN